MENNFSQLIVLLFFLMEGEIEKKEKGGLEEGIDTHS